MVLLDDHAVGQVLGVIFEELSSGAGAVGQLQLLQLLQLDEAGQAGGGQQGATWTSRRETTRCHHWVRGAKLSSGYELADVGFSHVLHCECVSR